MIYLDNAATTLYKPRAVDEAVRRAMHAAAGYARGGYAAAARAGELVYGCREQAAALAGAPIKIKVREAGDEPVQKKNTAVDEIIGRAKAFDIQVKEL